MYSYVTPTCIMYVLVCYSYITCMYSYVLECYLYVLLCYLYVLVCYSYVLVWCSSHDPINHAATNCSGKIWVHGLVKLSVGLVHLSYSLSEGQFGKPILSAPWTPTFLMKPTSASTLRVPGGSLEPLIFAMRRNTSMPFSFSPAAIRYRGDSGSH